MLNVTVEVCGLGFKLGGARVVWDLGTKSYEAGVLNLYHCDINDNAVPYNSDILSIRHARGEKNLMMVPLCA